MHINIVVAHIFLYKFLRRCNILGKVINYFVNTNFPEKVSFEYDNFKGLRVHLSLNNCISEEIDECFKNMMTESLKKDLRMEIIRDSLDNSIKGMIFPNLSVGILLEQSFPNSSYSEKATEYFKSAGKIHDQIEKIYISNTDFKKLDQINENLIAELFEGKRLGKNANVIDRFFGAMTVNKSVNYIENLTEGLNKRYFIKGRAGTGKSTFMKKIAKAAIEHGYDVEKYHCSFAPDSLDMVVIREIGTCIFDSTAPHELFPSKESDSIIDIFGDCVALGTEEKYEEEIQCFQSMYDEMIHTGREYLKEVTEERKKYNEKNGIGLGKYEKEIIENITKMIKSV